MNRRPTYNLTRRPEETQETSSSGSEDGGEVGEEEKPPKEEGPRAKFQRTASGATLQTISSTVNDRYYAVLPHGTRIHDWSEEEKLELNDHVRHMLHSRRSKFRRSMKGFGQYVRRRESSIFFLCYFC